MMNKSRASINCTEIFRHIMINTVDEICFFLGVCVRNFILSLTRSQFSNSQLEKISYKTRICPIMNWALPNAPWPNICSHTL